MKVLISACLLGMPCRYDACAKTMQGLDIPRVEWVPVCPEVAGGLSTPRPPAEIIGNLVINVHGEDVTQAFVRGAAFAVYLAQKHDIRLALLKTRSPSCGRDCIYDGTFSGTLTEGSGMTARALQAIGVEIYTEEELGNLDRTLARSRQSDQNAEHTG